MGAPVTIALDAMGGDHGPSVVIPAAAIALVRHPDLRFILVGDEALIAPELEAHPQLAEKSEIVHTDVAIAMDAKPSQALRRGRWKSSMWLAIQAVRDGQADAVEKKRDHSGAPNANSTASPAPNPKAHRAAHRRRSVTTAAR